MLSKIAYIELVNEQGTPSYQAKISLKNGNGHGDFFIPSNFSSGNYTLVAYTRWMKNFTADSFFVSTVTIVNPFMRSSDVARNGAKRSLGTTSTDANNSTDVQLKLSTKTFRSRDKVSFTLTGSDANVSVSVRKKEASLDDTGSILKRAVVHSDAFNTGNPLIPEIRGHLITGTLNPKNGTMSRKKVLASIPGSEYIFRAGTTDQQGNFALIVDSIPGSSTMWFQVAGDDINNYTLTLDDPFLNDHSKFRPEPLSLDDAARAIIDERNIYSQIENAYYESKRDSLPKGSSTSFFNVANKVYKLDDFTRFPTMEDIFREYVPEVNVRKVKGVFGLYVVNPTSGYPYLTQALLLIDGIPILDTNTLMAFDPLKVERIEIVTTKYFYGSLESDGIISLKTYEGAIEDLPPVKSYKEDLIGIQSTKLYSFPDYSTDKVKLARVPDYRLQLFWDPAVRVSKENATTIDLYTSDVTGDFEVVVEGFTHDGKLISLRDVFSVTK